MTKVSARVVCCYLLLLLLVQLSGKSVYTEYTEGGNVQQSNQIIFDVFDCYESVLLSWSLPQENSIQKIQIYRSDSVGYNFYLLTEVNPEITTWIDWEVEQGQYYFYQLEFIIENEDIIYTSKETPPFGIPSKLPEDLKVLNFHSTNDDQLDKVTSSPDGNHPLIVQGELDGNQIQFNLHQNENLTYYYSNYQDNIILNLTPVTRELDLIEYGWFVPLFFSENKMTEIVWLKLDSTTQGLFILNYVHINQKDIRFVNSVYEFILNELNELNPGHPLFATQSFEESKELIDFPVSLIWMMANHIQSNVDIIGESGSMDYWNSLIANTYNSPLYRGNRAITPNDYRDLQFDFVLESLTSQIETIISEYSYESNLRISEISINETGQVDWVKVIGYGGDTVQLSDFQINYNHFGGKLEVVELSAGEEYKIHIENFVGETLFENNNENKIYIEQSDNGLAIDSLWIPDFSENIILERDFFGEYRIVRQHEGFDLFKRWESPLVYINEIAIETDDSNEGASNIDKFLRIEFFVPNPLAVNGNGFKLIINGKENSLDNCGFSVGSLFNVIEMDINFDPKLELFVCELQSTEDYENWKSEQVVLLKNQANTHLARIPDGRHWNFNTMKSFSEPNTITFREGIKPLLPEVFALYQNFPNPFNAGTTIKFDLLEDATVTLAVVNAEGREVAEFLKDQPLSPGSYSYQWKDQSLSSGVYFAILKANLSEFQTVIDSRKMIYLK